VALFTAVWLAGCASRVEMPYMPGLAPTQPSLVRLSGSEFDYIDHLPHPPAPITGEEEHYWVRSVVIPSVGDNGQNGNLVTARYYVGKGAGAKPLVIVLPIWGVSAYPSNAISEGLTEHGAGAVNVLEILGKNNLVNWDAMGAAHSEAEFFGLLNQMVTRFTNTVIDIRRLVDWAQTQPDIDSQRIALIGFSMGALVAGDTIANEPRLAAGVLVMGAADPPAILATCNHEIKDAREPILERFGWSLDEFKQKLERSLAEIDPARYAGMADPSRVLIIEAGEDTCMPKSARERLWNAMGRPERISYLYDHRTAFLAMTFLGGDSIQHQIYRFFDRTLGWRSTRH
jgi:dienelactone hydrolase